MTCRELDSALDAGALTGDARRHAEECARCRPLLRVLEQGSANAAAADVRGIQSTIVRDLRPVRPLAPAAFYLGAMMIAVAAAVVAGAMLLHAYGWRALGDTRRIGIFAPLAVCAAAVAVWLERQMSPGRKFGTVFAWSASIAGALLAVVVALSFGPRPETRFVARGVSCLRAGVEFAVPVAVLVFAVIWRGASLRPLRAGAAAGALAGLTGLAILEVHCPNFDAWHIWLWHGAVVAICALAGLAAGKLLYKV